MTQVSETLTERGNRYGSFADHARLAQSFKRTMESANSFHKLSDPQRQSLEVIFDKIARILNGDPDYLDNWHDIQGYAKLVEDILKKSQKYDSIGGTTNES